jgi:Mrp family chromosome partitioning ATPase/capsular polysaccharide biosynthesis protein
VASTFFFPTYQASTLLQIEIRGPNLTANTEALADRYIRTEVELATSLDVLQRVASQYPGLSADTLQSEVTATALPDTHLFRITVVSSSPTRAASLADALAVALINLRNAQIRQDSALSEYVIQDQLASLKQQIATTQAALAQLGKPPSNPTQRDTLSAQLADLQQQYSDTNSTLSRIQVADATDASWLLQPAPVQPDQVTASRSRLPLLVASGIVTGVLLALVLVMLRGLATHRVRTVDSVRHLLGWPILAELGQLGVSGDGDDRALQSQHEALSDVSRSLAQSFEFLSIDRPLRSLAIVDLGQTRVSNAIASGLAMYLAVGGKRVLLVDARLVGGRQAKQFGLASVPGLSNAALDANAHPDAPVPLQRYVRAPANVHAPMLQIIPSGTPPPNPGAVLASVAMKRVLATVLSGPQDVTIFDASLVANENEPGVIAEIADGLLVVIDLANAHEDELSRMREVLTTHGANVLGCAVSGSPTQHSQQADSRPAAASTRAEQLSRR